MIGNIVLALVAAVPGAAPAYGHDLVLTVADSGRQIVVHRGERIDVKLVAGDGPKSDPTTWWHAVTVTGDALREKPQTAMALRGTTRARFKAVRDGETTLSSSRAVCPTEGPGPTCHAMQGWQVVIDVR